MGQGSLAPQRTASHAPICAITGGVVWALTPLRQPIFGAGRYASEGEWVFRIYNLVIVVAGLLTVALMRLRHDSVTPGRLFAAGWWTVLIEHVGMAAGSLPAVLLGGAAQDFVTAGKDASFLGAMLSALVPCRWARQQSGSDSSPNWAAALFMAIFPVGLAGTTLADALGVPEDYPGHPLTVLYGGAWVVPGANWARSSRD